MYNSQQQPMYRYGYGSSSTPGAASVCGGSANPPPPGWTEEQWNRWQWDQSQYQQQQQSTQSGGYQGQCISSGRAQRLIVKAPAILDRKRTRNTATTRQELRSIRTTPGDLIEADNELGSAYTLQVGVSLVSRYAPRSSRCFVSGGFAPIGLQSY